MAGRKKNGGDDTDTTVEDLVRDLSGAMVAGFERLQTDMVQGFDRLDKRIDGLETKLDEGFAEVKAEIRRVDAASIARDRKLEARVSRLETRVGKKRKKPARRARRSTGRSSSAR